MEPHQIIEIAFTAYNVPAKDALIVKRHGRITPGYAQIAHARYIVFSILIQNPKWSYHDLAALFKMDVKSVYTGIRRMQECDIDSELFNKYSEVMNRIKK